MILLSVPAFKDSAQNCITFFMSEDVFLFTCYDVYHIDSIHVLHDLALISM